MCSFEQIGLHFKAIFRRLSGAKSREINAEMQFKTPITHLGEFRNTLYPWIPAKNNRGSFSRSSPASACISAALMVSSR